MWKKIKELLPAIELSFDAKAESFNQRFSDKRAERQRKDFVSDFTKGVKLAYVGYIRNKNQEIKVGTRFVPEKTRAIIAGRIEQLNAMIKEAEGTGDDTELLLYVLSLVFVQDENMLATWIDPLSYQAQFIRPLKEVLQEQAREGFSVALPVTQSTQQSFIQSLQQEINTLSLENVELRDQLQSALLDQSGEIAALQRRVQSSEKLIASLEKQARAQVQPEEVAQSRTEARAIFKARLMATKNTQSAVSVSEVVSSPQIPPPTENPPLRLSMAVAPLSTKKTRKAAGAADAGNTITTLTQ